MEDTRRKKEELSFLKTASVQWCPIMMVDIPFLDGTRRKDFFVGFRCCHQFCQGKFFFFVQLFTNLRNFDSLISAVIIIKQM